MRGFHEYDLALEVRLGIFFILSEDDPRGRDYLVKHLPRMFALQEDDTGSHRAFSQGAHYRLPIPHQYAVYLSYCLIKIDSIGQGLQIFDMLNARRISEDSHLLALIEMSEHRDRFMRIYLEAVRARHLPDDAKSSRDHTIASTRACSH